MACGADEGAVTQPTGRSESAREELGAQKTELMSGAGQQGGDGGRKRVTQAWGVSTKSSGQSWDTQRAGGPHDPAPWAPERDQPRGWRPGEEPVWSEISPVSPSVCLSICPGRAHSWRSCHGTVVFSETNDLGGQNDKNYK